MTGGIARRRTLAADATAVLAFVAFTTAVGVPALRHDWSFPTTHTAAIPYFADALSTWHSGGLGEPVAYPNQYLYFAVMLVLAALLPPTLLLAIILTGVAVTCAVALRMLLGGALSPWTAPALLTITLFNSWTYNELVAGHVTMLVAFAGTLLLAACMISRERREWVFLLAVLLIAQQIQFYVVSIIALAVWAIVTRKWLPFTVGALLGVPTFVGITFGYDELAQIPYTLAWQRGQSVQAVDAIVLSGYYANYDQILQPLAKVCAGGLAIAALFGFLENYRSIAARMTFGTSVLFLLIALGTNGPFPGLYEYAVLHVKASGLFRELYDLLGYVLVGYVLLSALHALRSAKSTAILLLIAVGMFTTWCFAPPSRYWVAGARLPSLEVRANEHTRYAVMPAFQPLSYENRGSGPDPDLYGRPQDVEPINQYLPDYPAVSALSRYVFLNDTSLLRGLSVSRIYARRGFCSDVSTLRGQFTDVLNRQNLCGIKDSVTMLNALPELSLESDFNIASLTQNVGAGNILVSDAASDGLAPNVLTIVPQASNDSIDSRKDWITASLAFLSHPEIGQSYGGVYTSSRRRLSIRGGMYALAYVKGKLLDGKNDALLASKPVFQWIFLSQNVDSVRCVGSCAIAVLSDNANAYPINPPAREYRALDFRRITPWLITAIVPPMQIHNVLRFNERYSPWWRVATATGKTTALMHVRIDGAVNGWVTKAPYIGGRLFLVEMRSFVEQLAELFSTIAVIVVFAITRKRKSEKELHNG